ncbi:MAG: SURF1 family protein [Actinobacteria bacterium]|nr:SURF1 family protein [Actinomycetota bacterium]
MLRFLREPRWIALIIAVPIGVVLCLQLSDWQWNRYEGRKDANAVQTRNAAFPVAPVAEVMSPGGTVDDANQWRAVTETGVYDADGQILVRRKPLGGSMGFWVATPLTAENGDVLIVNRGWVAASAGATTTPDVPPPPTGTVTVTGRVQGDVPAAKERANDIPVGQVSSMDVSAIAAPLGAPVYPGYLDLVSSNPQQAGGLTPIPQPQISEGSHLSYSLQWIVFAIMFVVGLGILIRREIRFRREEAEEAEEAELNDPPLPGEPSPVPHDSHR